MDGLPSLQELRKMLYTDLFPLAVETYKLLMEKAPDDRLKKSAADEVMDLLGVKVKKSSTGGQTVTVSLPDDGIKTALIGLKGMSEGEVVDAEEK